MGWWASGSADDDLARALTRPIAVVINVVPAQKMIVSTNEYYPVTESTHTFAKTDSQLQNHRNGEQHRYSSRTMLLVEHYIVYLSRLEH